MGSKIKLVLGTSNQNKLREYKSLLPSNILTTSIPNIESIMPEETGLTFLDNAILKAKTVFSYSKTWTMADDSGLVVKSLNNKPGVHSKTFAGENATDQDNIDKLLEELNGKNNRDAYLITSIALVDPDGKIYDFEGKLYGTIANDKHGEFGFGYDPVFIPNGYNRTLAQMSQEKNNVSHRYVATKKLVTFLNTIE